ncbi:hypothetical protein ACOMHN_013243 [Nucella lapillus]
MTLNGILITNSENTYPYRAMLETLLTYGPDAQQCGYLECCLFASDTPGHMDATTGDDNRGLKHRRNASARSQTMDLMDRFSRGYGIFCFDLTPSLVDGEQFELVKSAPLRLELKFAKALPNPVVVLIYGELDGLIEVDKSRQVLTDFALLTAKHAYVRQRDWLLQEAEVYHNRRNLLQVQRTTDLEDNQLSPTNKLKENYCFLAKIGFGTNGEVGKYQCLRTRQMVAIKTTRCSDQSGKKMPLGVRREFYFLSKIKHENIVVLRDMMLSKGHGGTFVHLVYEFCEHDLAGLVKCKELTLYPGEIKWVMKHLLEGVAFMHECNIMHRDLKTANILITNQGVVKIADFGMARRTLLKGQYVSLAY